MEKFKELVKGLKAAGVKCSVKQFSSGDITVELGWNYPDELFFKVDQIAEQVGVDVDVCAEVSGGICKARESVNGGPRRWSLA